MIENWDGHGIGLARRFYQQWVLPLLGDQPHGAALLGTGSEVLGFDDDISTDHGFGPRVLLFVPGEDVAAATARRLDDLDGIFEGLPVRYPHSDGDAPRRQVQVHTVASYFTHWLGVDPAAGITVGDWIVLPTQILASMTAGAVFRDLDGALGRRREALAWYPDDVWRYALAVGWLRIGQEEAFVGRTGGRGDDLGSRVLAARLARDMMKLAFLVERRYAPYPKWFGHAFAQLRIATDLKPHLDRALAADAWRDREAALGDAGRILGEATNRLGLAAEVDPAPRQFHNRDISVPGGQRYTLALCREINDPELCAILERLGYRHGTEVPSLPGTIDQAVDSTDVLAATDRCRAAGPMLGFPPDSNPRYPRPADGAAAKG